MQSVCPHRYGHDRGEDLRLHDDNGLLQTEQSQEAQATTWSSGQLCNPAPRIQKKKKEFLTIFQIS